MLFWWRVRTRTRSAIEDLRDFIIPSLSGVSRVRLPSPPVTHLLKSNDPPTEDEAALIREAIDLAEVEQSRLRRIYDSRMLTGTRAHASITRYKMRQLNRFIEKHKALLSSIRLLPAEIWQEIFHWLSPRHHLVSSSSSFHVPWELAQVCGDWRMNALAMSDLWRYLPALYLTDSNPKTNLQLHYLGALIHRSKGAPLSIDIQCSISHDQRFHPVIALLCQHSDQWEDVRAMLSTATLTGLRYIEGRLPLLKSLVLSVFDDTQQVQPNSPFTMFTIAPKLRTVELAGLVNGEVLLPFQQLVNYTEVSLRDSHLNQILNDGLLLETLTLLNFPANVAFPFVTVPHLKKLEVKFWRGRTAHGRCFDNLILPSVEEIRATSDQVNIMPSLAIMLSKCGTSCPLKTLFIQCGPIACNELTNVIALTPLLANLNTSLPLSGAEEDIHNLANGYQDRPLAPMLETCHFYLGDAVGSASTSAAINALASSRCELAAIDAAVRNAESLALLPGEIRPLKDLTIYFKRGMPCAEKQLALLENWHAGTMARALQDMEADISRRVSWFHMPVAYKDEWMRWLAQVDNVEVEDFNDIYYSRIHYVLKQIATSTFQPISSRAQQILNKWDPLLKAGLKNRHWAFKDLWAVVYIANNHGKHNLPLLL